MVARFWHGDLRDLPHIQSGGFRCMEIPLGGSVMSNIDILFAVAGTVLVVLAIILILKKLEVSAGHSAIIVIGAALLALPYVANFEWTGSGIRFTTRDQGSQLAEQIAANSAQLAKINADIAGVADALKSSNERIAAIEAKQGGSATQPPVKPINPAFFDRLIQENNNAKLLTNRRLQDLDMLKQSLSVGN